MICGHNSGRSQMAQAAFNTLKKIYPRINPEYEAISWGTGIKENGKVNPKVIEPMKAIGMDLTNTAIYFPKDINHPLIKNKLNDVVRAFTMGCMNKKCELPLGMQIKTEDVTDWDLEDPADDKTDVNAVRDKIIGKTLELLFDLSR